MASLPACTNEIFLSLAHFCHNWYFRLNLPIFTKKGVEQVLKAKLCPLFISINTIVEMSPMLRSASVSLLSDQVYNNWCSGRPVTARQQPCICEVRGEGGAGNMEILTFNFTFLSFTTALESIDLPKQR